MFRGKDFPDHHDAELVLKLYELRREAVMRESRASVNGKFWPKSAEEAVAVLKGDHPLNAAFRQVVTYWEMAYGMVKHGILHGDYMLESSGEGLYLYARCEPYVEEFRKSNPTYFRNTEWITKNTEGGRSVLEMYRTRVKNVLATR